MTPALYGARFGAMMHCFVSVTGRDRETHILEVEAASLFDAIDQAEQQWALLGWYKPDEVAEVRFEAQLLKVRLELVRHWREMRAHTKPSGAP